MGLHSVGQPIHVTESNAPEPSVPREEAYQREVRSLADSFPLDWQPAESSADSKTLAVGERSMKPGAVFTSAGSLQWCPLRVA